MAQEFYVITQDGQEVQIDDLTLLGSVGGLADDKVIAELLRLAPFGGAVSKAIVPFGHQTSGPTATVSPAGATGSVTISPFRAVAGSRDTLANTSPLAVWNDLRSGIFTGAAQGTLTASLQIAANTTTNPRWDLVYAALQVDANGVTAQRYRKDPTTEQVTMTTVVNTRVQTVTVTTAPGAAATPPVKPALPPDANGTYFFPLAYVRVPAGFNATSTILAADIDEVMPFVPLARTLGAATLRPADQQWQEGGTVLGNANFAWTAASGQRPGPYMPPSMAGAETLLIALDLGNANSAMWSHPNNGVVDSRDWRFRLWDWRVYANAQANSIRYFPWAPGVPNAAPVVPQAESGPGSLLGSNIAVGMGQSFTYDDSYVQNGMGSTVVEVGYLGLTNLANGSIVRLYVDHGDGGKLKVGITGTPTALLFIWLTASGPYPNAR